MLAESLSSGDGFPSLLSSPDANNLEPLLPGNPSACSKGGPENMFPPNLHPHVLPTRPYPGHQTGHTPSGTRAMETGRRPSFPSLTKPRGRGEALNQRLGMKSTQGETVAAALWATNHLPERTSEQSCSPAWTPGLPELWAGASSPRGHLLTWQIA